MNLLNNLKEESLTKPKMEQVEKKVGKFKRGEIKDLCNLQKITSLK